MAKKMSQRSREIDLVAPTAHEILDRERKDIRRRLNAWEGTLIKQESGTAPMLNRLVDVLVQRIGEITRESALLFVKEVVQATYNAIIRAIPDEINAIGVGELWLRKKGQDVEWQWKNVDNDSFTPSWSLSKLVRRVTRPMELPWSGFSDCVADIVPVAILENRDPWGALVVSRQDAETTVAYWEAPDIRSVPADDLASQEVDLIAGFPALQEVIDNAICLPPPFQEPARAGTPVSAIVVLGVSEARTQFQAFSQSAAERGLDISK